MSQGNVDGIVDFDANLASSCCIRWKLGAVACKTHNYYAIVDNAFNNQTGYRNNTKTRRRVETDRQIFMQEYWHAMRRRTYNKNGHALSIVGGMKVQ